jgi:hypothetical protein
MEYVMVPVPEDHVVDVMQYIARLVTRAAVVPWNKESVSDHFDEIEEVGRALLSFVARSTVAGKDVTEEDAASELEMSTREIREIAREINVGAQRKGFEPMFALREASIVLPNKRTVQRQVFSMADAVARMIRAHERATSPVAPSTAMGSE